MLIRITPARPKLAFPHNFLRAKPFPTSSVPLDGTLNLPHSVAYGVEVNRSFLNRPASWLLSSAICLFGIFILSGCGGSNSSSKSGVSSQPQTNSQNFSCPVGQEDVMQYFALDKQDRETQFMNGQPNPLYTQVFPDQDFAPTGYWFWLKSANAHGFDVKSFDQNYVYLRSTELDWNDSTTFKRFVHDLPVAARCVTNNQPGPQIQVPDTSFQYFSSCGPYKSSHLGTSVNDLDAPMSMDTGGNIGRVMTRVLHYRYNCDSAFQNCIDEEQSFLAQGYGRWQWKYYHNGAFVKSTMINNLADGAPTASLPCPESYE
jgi:hypothetical protein